MIVEISGLGGVLAKLKHVGKPATQRLVIRGAVRKSGTPFNKVARRLAPKDEGNLKRSFKVRTYTNERGYPEAKFGSVSPVAHLLERGTSERFRYSTVDSKSGGYPSTGSVTARRFGEKAFRSTRFQIRKLMGQNIAAGIERELQKQGAK